MKTYHVATDEELKARECCEDYSLLVGPDGFECLLTEPEDRTWHRDGREVIDELNRLYDLVAELESKLPYEYKRRTAHPDPE